MIKINLDSENLKEDIIEFLNSIKTPYEVEDNIINIFDKSCADCKYWNRGMCKLSKYRASKYMKSGCGLYTTPDFHCKLYDDKKNNS